MTLAGLFIFMPTLSSFSQGHFFSLAQSASWPFLVFGFYLAGLALSLTPCCLPLLPIIGGLVVRQTPRPSTARALLLSLCYVLGLSGAYALAGVFFAYAGESLQLVFQKPAVIVLFSGVFLVLALSMLGVFTLQMPSFIQSKASAMSARQNAASLWGMMLMGALSALIVTACVAPALVGALAVISRAGSVLRGSAALFTLGLGMGTPLVLFGATAGKWAPKAGPWMVLVKRLFGVLFIAVAVSLLTKFISGSLARLLWSLPAFMASWVFLYSLPHRSLSGWVSLALSLVFLLFGLYLLFPALRAASSKPVIAASVTRPLHFKPIGSLQALHVALTQAAASHRPILLDFSASWCTACKEMTTTTFADPGVKKLLSRFTLLEVDLSTYTAADQALLNHFGIYGPPSIAFFNAKGALLPRRMVVGYMPARAFKARLSQVLQPPGP